MGRQLFKEFIATLLGEKFCVTKTLGNANSQLGLPLAILNDSVNADVRVFEMGMSFPGELAQLVSIAPPEIGVLTQISLVHAENFANLEEIAKAKCELFKSKGLKRGFFSASTLDFDSVRKLRCDKVVYSYDADELKRLCF